MLLMTVISHISISTRWEYVLNSITFVLILSTVLNIKLLGLRSLGWDKASSPVVSSLPRWEDRWRLPLTTRWACARLHNSASLVCRVGGMVKSGSPIISIWELKWLNFSVNWSKESQPVSTSRFNWKNGWGRVNQLTSKASWPRSATPPSAPLRKVRGAFWRPHRMQKNERFGSNFRKKSGQSW